ncbi:MAG: PH domain-containing protein [Planctomycetota bacterium]
MPDHTVLRDAEFSPSVKTYYMLRSIFVCIVSVIGIAALPIVFLIGYWLIQKYLDNLSCTLTERTLELKRGILNKTESTIPLEKITDLQMFQGPVMRHFGIHGFKVETAGQSNMGAGSLLSIIGIDDAPAFRQAVLAQRDAISEGNTSSKKPVSPEGPDPILEIRDALLRIEKKLDKRG